MGCATSTTSIKEFDSHGRGAKHACVDAGHQLQAAKALQLVIDAAANEDEEEVEGKSTMKSWNMMDLPGVPLPPNRRMHEQHQRRLDRFLRLVEG